MGRMNVVHIRAFLKNYHMTTQVDSGLHNSRKTVFSALLFNCRVMAADLRREAL